MNLLDMLSISLHYFCRKWIGATNENSNFDLKVYRSKGGFRRAYKRRDISEGVDNQNRKSASKQSAPVLIKIRFTCTGVCPIMISCWCKIKLQTVIINKSVFPLSASISPWAICGWENYLISYSVEFQKTFCSRCCCCSNSFQYIRRGGTRLF